MPEGAGRALGRLAYTVGGLGRLPGCPGTFGSLAGVAVYLALWGLGGPDLAFSAGWGLFLAALAAGLLLGAPAERWEGGGKDPSCFVLDEFAGMLLALAGVAGPGLAWKIPAAFLLFRLFDIEKPWPIAPLQRLEGGAGIMADDLAAGALANLGLRLIAHLL